MANYTLPIVLCALLGCGDTPPTGGQPDAVVAPPIDSAVEYDAMPEPDAAPPDAAQLVYDCDDLPEGTGQDGMFDPIDVAGAVASEDLAFDDAGNLVGSDNTAIFKSTKAGAVQLFVPNLDFRAGMRYLPDGHLVYADNHEGSLVRVDPAGVQYPVLAGLSYPNGIAVDAKGKVYVTEHDADRVRRIDPYSGEFTVILEAGELAEEGSIASTLTNPNGVTFDVEYEAVYLAGFNGDGTLYRLPLDSEGTPGDLEVFATDVGSGWLDGLAVDACGNVYVCDYGWDGDTDIYRISPDGLTVTRIIRGLPGAQNARYLPNLQWGSGLGGWSETAIYMPDGWDHSVYEVELGVPSKPRIYP